MAVRSKQTEGGASCGTSKYKCLNRGEGRHSADVVGELERCMFCWLFRVYVIDQRLQRSLGSDWPVVTWDHKAIQTTRLSELIGNETLLSHFNAFLIPSSSFFLFARWTTQPLPLQPTIHPFPQPR